MKALPVLSMTAEAGEYNASDAASRIIELRYKETKDAAGKVKPKVSNAFACVPMLILPSTGESSLDSILLSVMNGYQEELIRELRWNAGNPASMSFKEAEVSLPAVIKFGTEKASSLKLTEQNIAQWWTAEGKDAVSVSICASSGVEINEDDPKQRQTLAAFGATFAKLAAPTPDVSEDVAQLLIKRISVLGNECSPICHSIRRKLQARIDASIEAKKMAELLGSLN